MKNENKEMRFSRTLIGSRAFCELKEKLERIDAEKKVLSEFAREIIRDYCWNLGDPDGGTVQDLAEKLGLIEPCTATEEDIISEFDEYAVGDTIFKFTDILKGDRLLIVVIPDGKENKQCS